jgi:hypothetical protein
MNGCLFPTPLRRAQKWDRIGQQPTAAGGDDQTKRVSPDQIVLDGETVLAKLWWRYTLVLRH